ncbi:hypothetical protein AAFF_G00377360 [Aldrovandia affinis]|uniref:Uncharacterized protein n=1 Tax=Aldrovandia affinis TaxID=143900 RepID=A0AAD7SFT1_9TELE|nr:hypothetical protein AAFF_G00377360 [Aldrovandia affinis]
MHAAEDGDRKEERREGGLQPVTQEPPGSYQSTGKSLCCGSSPRIPFVLRAHGLHRAWQTAGGGQREEAGTAEPHQERPEPQTGWVEEETPSTPPLSQGAHAILEQAWPRTPSPRFGLFCSSSNVGGLAAGAKAGPSLKGDILHCTSWFF